MRIFDTFMFDGELILLRHRLAELHDLVDFFVLVEADRTYTNQVKSLVFAAHRSEFQWAAPKLRPVALANLGGAALSPRERAALQRNAVCFALRDAAPDDVVLLLDVDEIPSRAFLLRLRGNAIDLPCRLEMTRHYAFLNVIAPASPCCPTSDPSRSNQALRAAHPGIWDRLGQPWLGYSGVAVRYGEFAGNHGQSVGAGAFSLRFGSGITAIAPRAGRHLCAVDPSSSIGRKLPRAFHTEHASRRSMSEEHLGRCRRYGVHHLGWWCSEIPAGPLPQELARLATAHPELVRDRSFGPRLLRQIICAWGWLRLSHKLSDELVSLIDRRFSVSMCILGVPLLLLQLARSRFGCLPRPGKRQQSMRATVRGS